MAKAETTTKRVRVKKPTTGHPAIKSVTSTDHKTTPIAKAEPKAKVVKAAKPTLVKHDFATGWSGDSAGVNLRVSRTPIDVSRFGSSNGPLTERDRANLTSFREQFGNKPFERSNLDAGIIRRLGERGYLAHVSGGSNEATAKFKLTNKKLAA